MLTATKPYKTDDYIRNCLRLEADHPVTLACVLAVIEQTQKNIIQVDSGGYFWKAGYTTGAVWDLRLDDYEEQDEKTKEFITKFVMK